MAQPFHDSSGLLQNIDKLRRRARKDGYLFLRAFLPAEAILSVYEPWLEIIKAAAWLKPGTAPELRIADDDKFCLDPEPDFLDFYQKLYRVRAFHALAQHPILMEFFSRFFGEQPFLHANIVGRVIFPHRNEYTTPAHQDWPSIECSMNQWAVWIPLQDCPLELGGLAVAEGCHHWGELDFQPALGANSTEIVEPLDGRWRASPFALGDVVIFNGMTPHKGLPNKTDKLRLSVDYRYQPASDWITPDVLLPQNRFRFSWQDVYRDWPEKDSLKYYWKNYDLIVKAKSERWTRRWVAKAFAMAEQDDVRARSSLTRIAVRNPDRRVREKARVYIDKLNNLPGPNNGQ